MSLTTQALTAQMAAPTKDERHVHFKKFSHSTSLLTYLYFVSPVHSTFRGKGQKGQFLQNKRGQYKLRKKTEVRHTQYMLNSPMRHESPPVTPITTNTAETSTVKYTFASRTIRGESTPSIISRMAKELNALTQFSSWMASRIPLESNTYGALKNTAY